MHLKCFPSFMQLLEDLGPVVQNIVSLTKLLVEDLLCLILLTKSTAAIFFAKK